MGTVLFSSTDLPDSVMIDDARIAGGRPFSFPGEDDWHIGYKNALPHEIYAILRPVRGLLPDYIWGFELPAYVGKMRSPGDASERCMLQRAFAFLRKMVSSGTELVLAELFFEDRPRTSDDVVFRELNLNDYDFSEKGDTPFLLDRCVFYRVVVK